MRIFEGKLKYLTLFIAGGVADLALAPFYFFLVLLISFPVFFRVVENAKNKRQAFFCGWMFGFGYFVFGLYWIANSLLVDAERFAWLIPFAVCGIPFGLAIYIGLFAAVYKALAPGELWRKVVLFAALWVVFELLRGWLFTGFPWNLIGYAALASMQFSQLAAYGGVYLLSYAAVIVALIPVYMRDRGALVAAMVVALVGLVLSYHHLEFDNVAAARTAKVIIFQPNIAQTMKNDELESKKQFIENIDYMRGQDFKDADIVLWPESGVPYDLSHHPSVVELLAGVTPENGVLVTGALRTEGQTRADFRFWNTLYAVSRRGIYRSYDKIHLVPFGEFVPFRKILPLVNKITPGDVDFSSGERRDVIKYKDKNGKWGPGFLPLICYEVIFPEFALSGQKPDLLVNITNDGWFGDSTGPQQHLAMARMRSIEEGIPLLRAANTGISAIVDSNGRVLASLALNRRGVLQRNLELGKSATIYSAYGDKIISGLIVISIAILLIFRRKR